MSAGRFRLAFSPHLKFTLLLRSGLQNMKKKGFTWSSYRRCLKLLTGPALAGNVAYAFSIPGFSWKKKEEQKAEEKKEVDSVRQILQEADRLYSQNEAMALYDYLIKFKDMENDEVLWRLARAAVDKGKLSKEEEKRKLYYEAFDYVKRALALNQNNFAVHKWYAILLDYTGEFEGNKARITNSFQVKEHFQRAIELNPKDATSVHSLGQWCFIFADMPWYQRQIASVIFKTPPTSTYEEALKYFLQAEETEPNFYSMNLLMLGKTYMKLRNPEMAFTYLKRCMNYPIKTPDDQKAHDEAVHLLKVMGVFNKPALTKLVNTPESR